MTGPDVATTAEQRIDHLRRSYARAVVQLLRDGQPQTGLVLLLATVEEQAHLAGCGVVSLPLPLPR